MEFVVWLESFRIAFREMRRHRMRSTLTMLGVIIGVAAIIAVVSVSQGAKHLSHRLGRFAIDRYGDLNPVHRPSASFRSLRWSKSPLPRCSEMISRPSVFPRAWKSSRCSSLSLSGTATWRTMI